MRLSPHESLFEAQASSIGMAEKGMEQEECVEVELPRAGTLAEQLERSEICRGAMRATHRLLAWPSPQLIGTASLKTLGLNEKIIYVALEMWSSVCRVAKPPPIQWLKKEAG